MLALTMTFERAAFRQRDHGWDCSRLAIARRSARLPTRERAIPDASRIVHVVVSATDSSAAASAAANARQTIAAPISEPAAKRRVDSDLMQPRVSRLARVRRFPAQRV